MKFDTCHVLIVIETENFENCVLGKTSEGVKYYLCSS